MDGWSEDELAQLREKVAERRPVGAIARELDRPFAEVATKAGELTVLIPRRARKIPRGVGYDKQSVKRHVVALWRFDGTIPQYARIHGLHPDAFVASFRKNFPDAFHDYCQVRGTPESRDCGYCGDPFFPINGNQRYCTPKCGQDAKRDEEYFGGNRKNTVGLLAGVCQVCGAEREKGLSSHHVYGKENDPGDEVLIALCRGCHQLVTILGARKFVEDPAALEALISLALLRQSGRADRVRVEIQAEQLAAA